MVINRSIKTGTTATKTMAFSSCVDVEVGELVAVEAVEVATTDKMLLVAIGRGGVLFSIVETDVFIMSCDGVRYYL